LYSGRPLTFYMGEDQCVAARPKVLVASHGMEEGH
jgi:hypothetical protein